MPLKRKKYIPVNKPKVDWLKIQADYLTLCKTKPIKPSEFCFLNDLNYNTARRYLRLPDDLRSKLKENRKKEKKKKPNLYMLDNAIAGPTFSEIYANTYKLTEHEIRRVSAMSLDDELFRLKANNYIESKNLENLRDKYNKSKTEAERYRLLGEIRAVEALLLKNATEWSRIEFTKQAVIKNQLQNMKLKEEKDYAKKTAEAEIERKKLINQQMNIQIEMMKKSSGIDTVLDATDMIVSNKTALPASGFEAE